MKFYPLRKVGEDVEKVLAILKGGWARGFHSIKGEGRENILPCLDQSLKKMVKNICWSP